MPYEIQKKIADFLRFQSAKITLVLGGGAFLTMAAVSFLGMSADAGFKTDNSSERRMEKRLIRDAVANFRATYDAMPPGISTPQMQQAASGKTALGAAFSTASIRLVQSRHLTREEFYDFSAQLTNAGRIRDVPGFPRLLWTTKDLPRGDMQICVARMERTGKLQPTLQSANAVADCADNAQFMGAMQLLLIGTVAAGLVFGGNRASYRLGTKWRESIDKKEEKLTERESLRRTAEQAEQVRLEREAVMAAVTVQESITIQAPKINFRRSA